MRLCVILLLSFFINISYSDENILISQELNMKELKKSAKDGDAFAQFQYANELYKTNKNKSTAKKYAQQAADTGLPEAQFLLGKFYETGFSVKKSYEKAFEYYQSSSTQGYGLAQTALGLLYRDGKGVNKDTIKAFDLFKLGAEQGVALAQSNLGIAYFKGFGVKKDFKAALK